MNDETITLTRPQTPNPVISQPSTEQKSETKYPTEIIDLPSKGVFYSENSPLSGGTVEVKMITAKEEDILTNQNLIRKGQVLDKLLESVLINKKIKIEEFLIADLNAIYIALRRLAYGDTYGPLIVSCTKCREENKDLEINLGELKYKEFDETQFQKGINNLQYTLPHSNRVITFKFLTSKDEAVIESEIKVNNKLKLNSNDLTTRFKQLITSVDGNTDSKTIRKFVDEELLSKDSLEFRKHIKNITPGIDMNYSYTCPHCDQEERITVPITAQFFWPEAGR